MKTENDDRFIEWFPFKNINIMVEKTDNEGVDDNGYSKKINSQPCHLGAFIISHSKRLMNDVLIALDVFKNHKIYYSDTDSGYFHKNDYNILREKSLIGKELFQSENDNAEAGIIYGLYSNRR